MNELNSNTSIPVQESNQVDCAEIPNGPTPTPAANAAAANSASEKKRISAPDITTVDDLMALVSYAHQVKAINLERGHKDGRFPAWNAGAALVVRYGADEDQTRARLLELMRALRDPRSPLDEEDFASQWASAMDNARKVDWCGVGALIGRVSKKDPQWRKQVLGGSKRERALARMAWHEENSDPAKAGDFAYLDEFDLDPPWNNYYYDGYAGHFLYTDLDGNPVYVEKVFLGDDGWDKRPEVDKYELRGLKNGTVCDLSNCYLHDKLERAVVVEGNKDQLAILDAFKRCGDDDRFSCGRWTVFSAGVVGNIPHVVAAVLARMPSVQITVLVDRDTQNTNLAGPNMAAKLYEKYGGRVCFALPPRGFKDAADVRWNHGACDGHAALVQLVSEAGWVPTPEAMAELAAEVPRPAEGIPDNNNVVQMAEARQKRQKGTRSGKGVGKAIAEPVASLEPVEMTLTADDVGALPNVFVNRLAELGAKLGMGALELCCRVGLEVEAFQRVAGSCALSQRDRRVLVVTEAGQFRTLKQGEFSLGVGESVGGFYDRVKWRDLLHAVVSGLPQNQAHAFVTELTPGIDEALYQHVLIERQYTDLAVRVDMFASHASMSIRDGRAYIAIPRVAFDESIGADIPQSEREAILADYLEHWPMFEEFLDLLAAARFAAARKKAYLWLRAESDWGKGLLLGVLERLGLVTELTVTQLEKVFNGDPVGLQMTDLLRSWVLSFNEFKSAKAELKQIEQSIQFSPKNLPICRAELYLKLFLSAEHVESLASVESGAEDQFCNRFALVEPEGTIDARPLLTASRGRYRDVLAGHVAAGLNRRVREYLELGKRGSEDRGDQVVADFHQRHGLGNRFTRLSQKLPGLCCEFREWVMAHWLSAEEKIADDDQGLRALSRHERLVHEHGLESASVLFVKSPNALLSAWLEAEFNTAERGKLTWKRADFLKHLPQIQRVRFHGPQLKVMCIGTIPAFEPAGVQEDFFSE